MVFKSFQDKYIVRIDKGEEVVASLKKFCKEQNITLGYFQGLGATNNAVLGLFKTSTKEYLTKEIQGDHEIASLIGNISQMDGEVYLHIHAILTDESMSAVGGHLTSAVISGTCEVAVTSIDGKINRYFDSEVGLNLYEL